MLEERPSNRPGRSNSLQRMLDLEKHFMIQRLQALDPNGAPTTYRSHPPVARSHIQARRPDFPPQHSSRASSRSPQRASFSAQRPPLVIQVDSARPSMTSTAEQYASLIDEIRISDSIADPDKPSPKVVAFQFPPDFEDRKSVCQSPSWEAYDRRKKERKDEKNERKEEKRKQEELRRERKKEEERKREMEKREQQNASRKPRRLSKPPPVTAQTQAQIQAAASNTPPVPRTQKPRPASVLGITFPSSHHDDGAERSSRKRSGSFTSLIRAPFEVRRASFDHARDAGFIGGIKLEQERFDAQQRADEANIHPALRKPKFDSRSSSPLRSPNTPSGRGNADSTQRRAYPPITILTASSKTRSLAAPDLSRMEKLRARVGLKPGTKNDKIERDAQSTGAPEANSTTASNASLPKYESDGEKKTSKMKEFMVPHSPSLAPEPLRLRTDKSNNTKRNINEKSLNIRIPHKDEGRSPQISAKSSPMTPKDHTPHSATKPTEGEPTLSELMAQDRGDGRDAALLLPPLRPPRKSSKRSLATNSSASSPSTATPRVQVAPSPSAASETPHNLFGLFDGAYTPPSLELNVPDEKTPAVAPKPRVSGESPRFADSDMRGNSLGIVSNHNSRPSQPSRVESSERPSIDKGIAHTSDSRSTKREKPTGRRPAKDNGAGDRTLRSLVLSSSSEDSSSDELQFHSPLSTPGTSRPQSEKELTPVPTDTELGPTLGERRKSTQLKHQVTQEDLAPPSAHSKQHHRKSSYHSDIEEDIELDRIQAAARKVMAAFPGNTPPVPPLPSSSRKDRRTQSDPDVASSAGFLPKLKLQQLKRKDKSKLGQVTSPSELDKDDAVREQLLGATIKAKSAVHLPQATKSQTHLSPPSPGLSPMSLPTPTFHRRSRSSISSPEASSKPLLSHTSRPSMDSHRSTGVDGTNAPVAKMFVECCGCKYYHDMPSRLYETMVNEDALMAPADAVEFKGSKAMTVRCPWCQHDMSTKCCAGLAAMVYVKERLH